MTAQIGTQSQINTQTLTVGDVSARPGELAQGFIQAGELAGGTPLRIPVIVINGVHPGPCVWVNGAIHGDEPEGPLTCHLLKREVDPAQLSGSLVLVPVLNVPAYEAAQRGNPLDTFSYDMNRIYPGKPDGYFSDRLAYAHMEQMVAVADYEVSIHSGGSHSYLSETIFATQDAPSQELARAMGRDWPLVLKAILPKGNPMSVMLEHGKTGITVELGGRSATGPGDLMRVARVLADGVLNVMRHYRMLPGEATAASPRYTGHQIALLAPASGLFLAEPEVRFQQPTRKGDLLARIYDVFGDLQAELRAPEDGQFFGLRALSNVTVGDWCCFYAVIEGELE